MQGCFVERPVNANLEKSVATENCTASSICVLFDVGVMCV